MMNKYKYTIKEINDMFGAKVTQTTLHKNLIDIYGEEITNYLVLGVKSKEELFFLDILRFFIGGRIHYGYSLDGRIFDAFLPSCGILVEYDGSYYHSDEDSIKRDKEKTSIAAKYGYKLFRVNETSIKDINTIKNIIQWRNLSLKKFKILNGLRKMKKSLILLWKKITAIL